MVWMFILLTVVTYSFVMKHVLSHIQKTVHAVNECSATKNENRTELASIQTVR
jgi:hypothetical protein